MGGRANPADCREGHNLVDIKATNAKHQGFAYYETAFVAGRDQVGELSLIAMISAPCALRPALCSLRYAPCADSAETANYEPITIAKDK